ncbi:MAG: hypothetical protein JW769_05630 [Parachlamydiales bacterium]|nr:hypothetical protein [Parachlamydiales bacterium]
MFTVDKHHKGKRVKETALDNIEISLSDLPAYELFFGGQLLQKIGKYALIVAEKHAETTCDPLGIDFVRFFSPIRKEDSLICRLAVTRAWRTSLEVGVKVIAEDFRMLEEKLVLTAYYTFLAVDDKKCPCPIFYVIPETAEEKKRYIAAERRRAARLKNSLEKYLFQ